MGALAGVAAWATSATTATAAATERTLGLSAVGAMRIVTVGTLRMTLRLGSIVTQRISAGTAAVLTVAAGSTTRVAGLERGGGGEAAAAMRLTLPAVRLLGCGLEALDCLDRCHEPFGKRLLGQLDPYELLDITQVDLFIAAAESDRLTRGTRARGTADAVDILLGHVGQVEVDDMADARNVNPARGDVRRDQDLDVARAEQAESALALALALVAVDGV